MKTNASVFAILLVLVMSEVFPAQSSPIGRGGAIVGGGLSISKVNMGYSGNIEDHTEVLVNPHARYFVADGLALGIGLRYWSIDETDDFGFALGVSYHFKIGEPLNMAAEPRSFKGSVMPFFGAEYYHQLDPNMLYFFSDNGEALSFFAGSDIMISNHAAVNLRIEYSVRLDNPPEYVFGPSFEGASKTMIRFLAGFPLFVYNDNPDNFH